MGLCQDQYRMSDDSEEESVVRQGRQRRVSGLVSSDSEEDVVRWKRQQHTPLVSSSDEDESSDDTDHTDEGETPMIAC